MLEGKKKLGRVVDNAHIFEESAKQWTTNTLFDISSARIHAHESVKQYARVTIRPTKWRWCEMLCNHILAQSVHIL